MRFFQCTLVLVVLTCVIAAPKSSRRPRSPKSSKTSLEPSESLPAVEADTSDIKDATRTKKQTTFCVEIKATPQGQAVVQQPCSPQQQQLQPQQPHYQQQQQQQQPQQPQYQQQQQQPQQPQYQQQQPQPCVPEQAQQPQPPQQPQYQQQQQLPQQPQYQQQPQQPQYQQQKPQPQQPQYQQQQPQPCVPEQPQPPQQPQQPQQPQEQQPTYVIVPAIQPQPESEISQPVNPYSQPNAIAPAVGYLPMEIPADQPVPGFTLCPPDSSSSANAVGTPCLCPRCPCGVVSPHASNPHFRNFMGEQADMMASNNAGMNPRMMMMIPGMNQKRAQVITPMDYIMRAAQAKAMEDALSHHRTFAFHKHGYGQNPPTNYFVKCPNEGITTSSGFSGLPNGAVVPNVGGGNMPIQVQRNSIQQNLAQVMQTSPQGHGMFAYQNVNAHIPNQGQTAKTWSIRSVDQPKEGSGATTEAPASPAQEVVTPGPLEGSENAKFSPSELIEQMRDSAAAQRVTRADNTDANVQMSVIGPGGQSYVLGASDSMLDGEMSDNRGQELSKREVEANETDSE